MKVRKKSSSMSIKSTAFFEVVAPRIFYFLAGGLTVSIIVYNGVRFYKEQQNQYSDSKLIADQVKARLAEASTWREENERSLAERERELRKEVRDDTLAKKIEILDKSKWTTHTLSDLGVRIKVPPYSKVERNNVITRTRKDQNDALYTPTTFSIRENPDRLSPLVWLDQNINQGHQKESTLIQELRIGEHQVIRMRMSGGRAASFHVFHDDKVLTLSSMDGGDAANIINQDDIRMMMIETFEFIK